MLQKRYNYVTFLCDDNTRAKHFSLFFLYQMESTMKKVMVLALFTLLATSAFAGRFADERAKWNSLSDDEKQAVKDEVSTTATGVHEDLSNKYDKYQDLTPEQQEKVKGAANKGADKYKSLDPEQKEAVKEKGKAAGKKYLEQF